MEPEKCMKKDKESFKFKVDKEKFESDKKLITREEILIKAGKAAECYELVQKFKNKKKQVLEANKEVDLSDPGVEKFFTIPKEQKEG